jgi:U4/U6.U5 tri-snRNP-associated protein 2
LKYRDPSGSFRALRESVINVTMVINRNVTFFSFRLPPYIILYIQRFTKNTFYVEKNPTIVNFPIKSIEFGDFLTEEAKEKYPNGAPYDLIANVVHEGLPKTGTYKLHILHKGKYEWI